MPLRVWTRLAFHSLCPAHRCVVVLVFYLLPSSGLITASSLRSFTGLALDQVCEATVVYKPLLLPGNFQSLLGSPAWTGDLANLGLRQMIQ